MYDLADSKTIDSWIWKNKRRLMSSEFRFGIDCNQNPKENFDSAELRICVAFMSNGITRGLSGTYNSIDFLVRDAGEGVFIDYSYFPYQKEMAILKEEKIPFIFGNVSHAAPIDYDMIFVSHSIIPETPNVIHSLHYSGIPYNYEDRIKDSQMPLLVYGGAAANECHALFGPTGRGGHSLLDIAMFGQAEFCLTAFIKETLQFIRLVRSEGKTFKECKERYIDFLKEKFTYKDFVFHPTAYKYHYEDDNFTAKSIEKLDPRVPDKVKFARVTSPNFAGTTRKVFYLDGSSARSHDVAISQGCAGEGCCSFCMEGNVNGAWVEKDLDDIVEDMKELRRSAATNTIGFYSFNLNYYKHFLDLLKEASKIFSNLSLINMRTDVLAVRPDYLRISKKMGLIRASMAVEGMGEHIRNHILNKNLSKEQLLKAVKNVFDQKFIMVKMGMIVTGVETEEDIKEWLGELDEIIEIRNKCDSKTSILLTHTPLQVYNQTPIRWFPRRMAEASLYNKKFLYNYISELKKREGVQIKFHGSGSGAFLEQFIIDVGRAGTKALIDFSIDEEVYFASHYGNREKEKILAVLERNNIKIDKMFEAKDTEKYIGSSDLIEFTTPFKLKEWKEMNNKNDFYHKICLVTPAQPEGKCYGCGYCSPELKERVINRVVENENTVDDIIRGFSEVMPRFSTRIILKVKPEWDLFSKTSLSHYITALFLRSSEYLEDIFFKLGRNSTAWVSSNGQKDWFSGYIAFDIYWKDKFDISKLKIIKDKINEQLHVAKIIGIEETSGKFLIKVTNQELSYLGEINGISYSFLKDKLSNFDEHVLTAMSSKGSGLLMEKKYIKNISKKVLMVQDKDRVRVFMQLPVSVNPYMVVSSITGWEFDKAMELCKFEIVDHSVKVDMNCNCGNPVSYSLIRSKMSGECNLCIGKRILYKIINK